VVSRPPPARITDSTFPFLTRFVHPSLAWQARGGRTTRLEHRGLLANTPSWLYIRRGAMGYTLRATHPTYDAPLPVPLRARTCTPRYHLSASTTHALGPRLCLPSSVSSSTPTAWVTPRLAYSVAPSRRLLTPTTTTPYATTFLYAPRKVYPLVRHSSSYGPLHCLARLTRHRRRKLYAPLLIGGQQLLSRVLSTFHRRG
jgi:hypothetical protein